MGLHILAFAWDPPADCSQDDSRSYFVEIAINSPYICFTYPVWEMHMTAHLEGTCIYIYIYVPIYESHGMLSEKWTRHLHLIKRLSLYTHMNRGKHEKTHLGNPIWPILSMRHDCPPPPNEQIRYQTMVSKKPSAIMIHYMEGGSIDTVLTMVITITLGYEGYLIKPYISMRIWYIKLIICTHMWSYHLMLSTN